MIALLAVGFAVVAQPAIRIDCPKLKLNPIKIGEAPPMWSGWDGLPEARDAPEQGKWADVDGTMRPAGTFLPGCLASTIMLRLDYCERYRPQCQAAIDKYTAGKERDCNRTLEITEAAHRTGMVKTETESSVGWSTTGLVIITTLAAKVAFWIGYAIAKAIN